MPATPDTAAWPALRGPESLRMFVLMLVLALQIAWLQRHRIVTAGRLPIMLLPTLLVTLVCLASTGCLLFTDAVNSSPTVHIVPPGGPFYRGQPIAITASVSDPDGDAVRLDWWTSMGDCPVPLALGAAPRGQVSSPPGDPTFDYTFMPGAPATVCVWVLATDVHGATAFDAFPIASQNRQPVARIQLLEPTTRTSGGLFELYSTFHVSAAMSSDPDGDPLQDPQFVLGDDFPPAAMPTPKLVDCPGVTPNPFVRCLYAGFAGSYSISLTVSDGLATSAPATMILPVDQDHPPCVSETNPSVAASPLVLAPSEAKTFTIVEILDDGAPLPTPADGAHASPTFTWQVRRNAGAWQSIVGYAEQASLTLPAGTYVTGDVIDVNVTISDGVAMHLQPACDPGCPTGCPQSAEWTVAYR
jgi:hypothetical protein